MSSLERLLGAIAGRATTLLPLSVALGLVFQDLAAAMKPLAPPLVVLLLVFAMLRIDVAAIAGWLRRPLVPALLCAAMLVVLPVLAAAGIARLGLPEGLALGLAVWALCPALTSAPAVGGFLGLDRALALVVSTATNLLVPLTLPPLALLLLGLDLEIGVGALGLRLVVLVGGAAAIVWLLRRRFGARIEAHAAAVDGAAVVVLMVFAIPLFDGATARAIAEPWRVAGFVAAAFALSAALNLAAALPFLAMGVRTGLTAGFLSGGRNIALLLAVLPATVDPDLFLFIAAAQFPIYIMPTLLRPLCRRLLPQNGA